MKSRPIRITLILLLGAGAYLMLPRAIEFVTYRSLVAHIDRVFAARDLDGIKKVESEIEQFRVTGWLARREKLQLWVAAVLCARRLQSPTFDAADSYTINVSPPPGPGGGFSGMDPKFIKDPIQRAGYEQRIAENHAKAENYSREMAYGEVYSHLCYRMGWYLSGADVGTSELNSMIEKCGATAKEAAAIRASLDVEAVARIAR